MNGETNYVLYPYHGILLDNKKEWTIHICNDSDGLQGIMLKENCVILFIKYPQKNKFIEIESRLELSKVRYGKEEWVWLQMDSRKEPRVDGTLLYLDNGSGNIKLHKTNQCK